MAKKAKPAPDAPAIETPAGGKRLRTEPTPEPTKGGSYDAESGECLQSPPEEKVHQRREE